ncbi:MAG: TonB-dependent receptor [Bdellovibrionota bacterium]
MNLASFILPFAYALFAAPSHSFAQIQNQPTEIVTATPLSAVSERVGSWPVYDLSEETMTRGEASIAESLNSLPGIAVRESGSPVVSIRGSAQADRVLRLLEGIPLNSGDGVGANEIFFPIEILRSATVIKGPASVFYGPAAMAGAIDYRIRKFERPSFGVSISTDNDFKTLGTHSALAVTPLKISDSKSQFSFFQETKPGKFDFQAKSTTDSGLREQNSSGMTRGTISSDFKAGRANIRTFALLAKHQGETPGSLISPFRSTFHNSAVLASVEAALPLSATDQISARVTQSTLWGLYDKETSNQSTSYNSRTGAALDGRFLLGDRVLSQTFVDIVHQELAASYYGASRYYQADIDVGETLQISVNPELVLTPAARFNSRTGEGFGAFSASQALGANRIYATYSEGYRAPSLSDRFANNSTFQGNPNLRSERSRSGEIGSFYENGTRYGTFFDGLIARSALFYTQYSNLIDSRTAGAVTTKVNVGEARVFGAEANVGYSFSIWTTSIAYGYLDSRNTTLGEPLRLSPNHQVSFTVGQQLGPVVIELKETIWSPYFDRHPTTNLLTELSGWESLDLTFRTVALTDWEFSGGVVNILDEARELTIGYPESQRRYFFSGLRSF